MTSTPEDSGEIFKRDTKGRVRVPKARREMLLDEWERSGGSAAQFADYVGIKYSTLANWIQKRRKQAGLKASLLKPERGSGLEPEPMVDGWKRSWKRIPSLKARRVRCGFILRQAPTVRLVMPERQDLPPS